MGSRPAAKILNVRHSAPSPLWNMRADAGQIVRSHYQLNAAQEMTITGMNAAVPNAVYHAKGIRVRELPVRIEDLLA